MSKGVSSAFTAVIRSCMLPPIDLGMYLLGRMKPNMSLRSAVDFNAGTSQRTQPDKLSDMRGPMGKSWSGTAMLGIRRPSALRASMRKPTVPWRRAVTHNIVDAMASPWYLLALARPDIEHRSEKASVYRTFVVLNGARACQDFSLGSGPAGLAGTTPRHDDCTLFFLGAWNKL